MSDDSSAVAQDTHVEQPQDPVPHQIEQSKQPSEVATLSAELAKWQSRVPKLASALKERTAEVSELQARLTELSKELEEKSQSSESGAGIRARDELIAELEDKQRALNERNRQAATDLHSKTLELEEQTQQALAWREKWQAMASSLDSQASETAQAAAERDAAQQEVTELRRSLVERDERLESVSKDAAELTEQLNSFESRNAKLLETTEFANTQIEALGENLSQLKQRLGEREAALVSLGETHDEQVRHNAEQQRQIESLQSQLDAANDASARQQGEHADRQAASAEEIRALKELVGNQVSQIESLDAETHRLASSAKQTEQALKDELDQALESRRQATAEQEQASASQKQAHEQALLTLRDELEREHAEQLARQEEALKQQAEAHAAVLAQLQESHEQALGELTLARDDSLAQLRSERDQSVGELAAEHERAPWRRCEPSTNKK